MYDSEQWANCHFTKTVSVLTTKCAFWELDNHKKRPASLQIHRDCYVLYVSVTHARSLNRIKVYTRGY